MSVYEDGRAGGGAWPTDPAKAREGAQADGAPRYWLDVTIGADGSVDIYCDAVPVIATLRCVFGFPDGRGSA